MDLTCLLTPQEICVLVEEADIQIIKNTKHKKFNSGMEVSVMNWGGGRGGSEQFSPRCIREGREADSWMTLKASINFDGQRMRRGENADVWGRDEHICKDTEDQSTRRIWKWGIDWCSQNMGFLSRRWAVTGLLLSKCWTCFFKTWTPLMTLEEGSELTCTVQEGGSGRIISEKELAGKQDPISFRNVLPASKVSATTGFRMRIREKESLSCWKRQVEDRCYRACVQCPS